MLCQKYDEILPLAQKPSRYIGEEANSIKKDLEKVEAAIVLAFPDLYEIGMAHLGLKILYHIINKNEKFAAERVFAPDIDYEELLREKGLPLASLESKRPLKQFDIIGFTLQYEMSYSNILNMIDMGNIPLPSCDRDDKFPLIIGGGPCAYNPEPISDFFDCFIIGDGEEVIIEFLALYSKLKKRRIGKNQLLRLLSEIKGVYVPSILKVEYDKEGRVKKIVSEDDLPAKIDKRILSDLNKVDYPTAPVVPFTRLTHDRVSLEIDRGCAQACRFCQAGYIYRPIRERTIEKIIELSGKSINRTGYDEISLLSLSSGDYSKMNQLLPELIGRLASSRVSLSLPSLRPPTISDHIINCMSLSGKAGFTIAVEAGSQRLRDVLNKNVNEEDIFEAVEKIALAGWEIIKVYFMVGLPTETNDDLEGIYTICNKMYSTAKKINPKFKRLNIGVSFFVPKPHTPFQWVSQDDMVEMDKKLNFLKSRFKSRSKYKIKWQNYRLSFLESVFARGDRRLGKVLLYAFKAKCRFDGWSDRFDYDKWVTAFKEAEIDPVFYTKRDIEKDEVFPWDFINIGVKKDYLFKEYLRSKEEIKEGDCRKSKCLLCGLEKICPDIKEKTIEDDIKITGKNENNYPKDRHYNLDNVDSRHKKNGMTNGDNAFKYRIKFTKEKTARFLSHFELISLLTRALRRSKIEVNYSKGFHPRPKISFGFALPVGMESKEELFDVVLAEKMEQDAIIKRLNSEMPLNMTILSATEIPLHSKSLSVINTKIRFKIYIDVMRDMRISDNSVYAKRLEKYLSGAKAKIFSENGTEREIELDKWFDLIEIQSSTENGLILNIVAKVNEGNFIFPLKILKALYPELINNSGNYRIVKEASYYDD